MTVRNIYIKFG